MQVKELLIDFAKHLHASGQLKKDTAINDEVKYYLENIVNLSLLGVIREQKKKE